MSAAWPPMPAWLHLDVAAGPVRRGDSVRLRWAADEPAADHELRLALVVHHQVRDLDGSGRLGADHRRWAIHGRAPLAGAEARLRVPHDAPYSYAGTVLAFLWGVGLARPDDPIDGVLGWRALQVLP